MRLRKALHPLLMFADALLWGLRHKARAETSTSGCNKVLVGLNVGIEES
jgi:hypothetical protein